MPLRFRDYKKDTVSYINRENPQDSEIFLVIRKEEEGAVFLTIIPCRDIFQI